MANCATVQADLDAAYAARRAALLGNYSLDTGQGRHSVTRPDLDKINALISDLEADLASCSGEDILITGSFQRH